MCDVDLLNPAERRIQPVRARCLGPCAHTLQLKKFSMSLLFRFNPLYIRAGIQSCCFMKTNGGSFLFHSSRVCGSKEVVLFAGAIFTRQILTFLIRYRQWFVEILLLNGISRRNLIICDWCKPQPCYCNLSPSSSPLSLFIARFCRRCANTFSSEWPNGFFFINKCATCSWMYPWKIYTTSEQKKHLLVPQCCGSRLRENILCLPGFDERSTTWHHRR